MFAILSDVFCITRNLLAIFIGVFSIIRNVSAFLSSLFCITRYIINIILRVFFCFTRNLLAILSNVFCISGILLAILSGESYIVRNVTAILLVAFCIHECFVSQEICFPNCQLQFLSQKVYFQFYKVLFILLFRVTFCISCLKKYTCLIFSCIFF